MDQWTQTKPGYKTKTITGDGFKVIIHRPELKPEEYIRREREVMRALAGMKGGVAV